eukprot:Pompholyxophrys_punicea_v1_NODE_751_length_1348_cov_4.706110.p2 type:complete len:129 gc:universal NODE_751_length_1348_cov_4.706110:560-174(-)
MSVHLLKCQNVTMNVLDKDPNAIMLVRSVDTDVAAILIGKWSSLTKSISDFPDPSKPQLWLTLGTGKHVTCRSIDRICEALGPQTAECLLSFIHLLDATRFQHFLGKEKKPCGTHGNVFLRLPKLSCM